MKNEGRRRIPNSLKSSLHRCRDAAPKINLTGLFLDLKHPNGMCGVALEDDTILNY